MKIGTKVSLLTTLLMAGLVAGISGVLFFSEKATLLKEIESRHETLVRTLRQAAEESVATKDDILLLNYMKLLRKTEGVSYAMVLRRDGTVIAHTDVSRWGMVLDDAATKSVLGADELTWRIVDDWQGRPALDLTQPVGAAVPNLLVRIGFSKDFVDAQIRAAMRQHQTRIFAIAAVALLIGFGLSLALSRAFLTPVRRLAEATAILGMGKLDHTIQVDSQDELGQLARDFNTMAEKLLELDHMKRDFVASVTHEFRSPLHSTTMYLGLFAKGGAGELTEKQKSYLKVIEQNTTRLGRFVDDLLDVAKLERGKMDVRRQEFDLMEVLKEVRAMFIPHSEQKKIRFRVAEAALPKAVGDSERTRQIVINLLSNAFKFTPEGGEVEVVAAPSNGDLRVTVRDSGLGIPNDKLDAIFNKFEQVKGVDPTGAGQPKGTGLGLAIVKGLVEAQGGKIWVESEPQKGSRFIFTLPAGKS